MDVTAEGFMVRPNRRKSKTIAIWLDSDSLSELDRMADLSRSSRSQVIRELVAKATRAELQGVA